MIREYKEVVRVGIVGLGERGIALLNVLMDLDGVEVPAVCDTHESKVAQAQALVTERGRRRPDGYAGDVWDFRRLVERPDLDAVITATPWEWHAPVLIAAMKAGKYGGTEVPMGVTLDECWELVETAEATGVPCMMLENVNYFRNAMMIFNMVRQGVFGELLHCEGGYQHDVRHVKFDAEGNLRWRGWHSVHRNGNLYPMHPIAPISCWLDINHGDRFTHLVSMSTRSHGLNHYIRERFGPDHPNARRTYALGDVNTTLLATERGRTVTLYHDTQSPRPYDLILRIQGTRGIYHGTLNKIYLEGRSPQPHTWEDIEPYYDEYDHPMWRDLGPVARQYGHGGGDYLALYRFIQTVRYQSETPIDVYDSVTWSAVAALSEQSVANGSTPVAFPDFTRGRWKTRPPIDIVGAEWSAAGPVDPRRAARTKPA